MSQNISNAFLRIASVSLFFLIWEISSRILEIDLLPGPENVFKKIVEELYNDELLFHTLITLKRVFISFCIAMLIGSFFGIYMGRKERLNTFAWELPRELSVPIASTKASPIWKNLHRYMSTPSASSSTLLLASTPFYSSHASLEYCVTRNIDVRSAIMKSKRTLYSPVWMTVSCSSTLVNLECLLQNES